MWIFHMSVISIALGSNENSYIFPVTDTSLHSFLGNVTDILLKKNWEGKNTFLLSALDFFALTNK